MFLLIIMGDPGFVKWFLQKLGKLERIFLGNWVMAYARADSRQFSAGSVVPGSEAQAAWRNCGSQILRRQKSCPEQNNRAAFYQFIITASILPQPKVVFLPR